MQRDAVLPAQRGDLLDRLDGADLPVGALQAGERGPAGEGRRVRLDVDPAEPVHPDRDRLERRRGVQDGAVLDGAVHHARAGATAGAGPAEHRERAGQGTAGREGDLVRTGSEHARDGLPRAVEQEAGAAPRAVQPRGVGPPVVERGEQRLARRRVQRRGGGRVQVGGVRHVSTLGRTEHDGRAGTPAGRAERAGLGSPTR